MRKAIVTAASKGIGWGIAEFLLRSDHSVGITARSGENLNIRAGIRDSRLIIHSVDHSVPGATRVAMMALIETLGGLDTLVLNAPPPKKGKFEALTHQEWQHSIQTNLMMNIEAIEAALPALKKSQAGRIILILSTAAKEPIDGLLISSTLRAGSLGLVKSLSREFATHGITINAILPGYTETPGLSDVLTAEKKSKIIEKVPLGKMASSGDHGALAAFLSDPQSGFITGQAIAVDGGMLQGI